MSLIKCPECNQSVSSFASHCPHCGYPIANNADIIAIAEVAKQEDVVEEDPEGAKDGRSGAEKQKALEDNIQEQANNSSQSKGAPRQNRYAPLILGVVVLATIIYMVVSVRPIGFQSASPQEPINQSFQNDLGSGNAKPVEETEWEILGAINLAQVDKLSQGQLKQYLQEILNNGFGSGVTGTCIVGERFVLEASNSKKEPSYSLNLDAVYSGEREGYPVYETDDGNLCTIKQFGEFYIAGVYEPSGTATAFILEPCDHSSEASVSMMELERIAIDGSEVSAPYTKSQGVRFTKGGYVISFSYNSATIVGTYVRNEGDFIVTDPNTGGTVTFVEEDDYYVAVIGEETRYYKQIDPHMTIWPNPEEAFGVEYDVASDFAEAKRIISKNGLGPVKTSIENDRGSVSSSVPLQGNNTRERMEYFYFALHNMGFPDDRIKAVANQIWDESILSNIEQIYGEPYSTFKEASYKPSKTTQKQRGDPMPRIQKTAVATMELRYDSSTQEELNGFLWTIGVTVTQSWFQNRESETMSYIWDLNISSEVLNTLAS